MSGYHPPKRAVEKWRDGPEGFFAWVDYIKPQVPTPDKVSREPITIADWQRDEIRPLLERHPPQPGRVFGECVVRYGVITWPRRHGKSLLNVLIALWRLTCWPGENIKFLANSAEQAARTSFEQAREIIKATPKLAEWIGQGDFKKNVQATRIFMRRPGGDSDGKMERVGTNDAALYGEAVTLVVATELHKEQDGGKARRTLMSSLGDSTTGQALMDSTTDGPGGPIHKYEQQQEQGVAGVYVSRIEYKDLEDAKARYPEWVSRAWIQGEYDNDAGGRFFAEQVLNLRSEAQNSLLRAKDIGAAKADFQPPRNHAELVELLGGRKYVLGGALDRSRGGSANGDATIWTAAAKVARDDGEYEYFVIHQRDFPGSFGKEIKKAIAHDHERFGLTAAVIEAYDGQDIAQWCREQGIETSLEYAHSPKKIQLFNEMRLVFGECRIHFPRQYTLLEGELAAFEETTTPTGRPSYNAPPGMHDDRVDSLAWALWATNDYELAAYELPGLNCVSHDRFAARCYLRGGNAVLGCADGCTAHQQVQAMYRRFSRRNVDDELTLTQFFKSKVRLAGCTIYQGI